MQDIVEKYIVLRDAKATRQAKAKTDIAKIDEMLEKIEAYLLTEFDTLGIDSVGCSSGTAYKSTKTSATVADWDAFFAYVKEHELWNMLEHRAAKNAVVEFKEANNDLPPGLNWREEITINVRRS